MTILPWLLGLRGANSVPYLWWSGVGVPAVVYVIWRYTCNIPGCHRLAIKRHEFTGKSFCRMHNRLGRIEAAAKAKKAEEGELPDA